MNEVIRVRGLNKIYASGRVQMHALKDVELAIEAGDFVSVMGHSGSGKSTLMNILGCLDRPSSGQYFLDGDDVSGLDRDRLSQIRNRKLGFVFQSYNLIPRTSALKNVALPMIYARRSAKEREQRAMALLERVGLADWAQHMPNEMSGGQMQRVAIARALANKPPVLLADEPTGNLDTASSVEIMELFQELNAEGTTIVLVTHEDDIALFTKRTVRFRDGRVISDERLV